MAYDLSTLLEASGAVISGLGSVYVGIKHLKYSFQDKKSKERQAILDKANEELAKVEDKLNKKINSLQLEFETHKTSLSKDLDFMQSTYNAEIKVLGERIESLREDLVTQHGQLVNLLTQLVSKS